MGESLHIYGRTVKEVKDSVITVFFQTKSSNDAGNVQEIIPDSHIRIKVRHNM